MRRRIANRLIILVCLSVILTGAAKAQSAHSFEVEIPFPFILEDRTFPAGKYLVQRIDPAKPNVLMLKNADARITRLMLTQRVQSESPSARVGSNIHAPSGKVLLVSNLDRRRQRRAPNIFVE